ncbi:MULTISPECIES: hypothetical protein [Paenibacillus]|jgi:hypothetical protein|uniref:hypothetical protein n=1 Tax=Paenibacillus TaxID=44249 RepID=UPI000287A628|nr:hypothetical protein [Paenibacillus senegalensis]
MVEILLLIIAILVWNLNWNVKKRLEIQERKLEELKTIVVRGFRMNNKQLDKLVDDRDGTEAKKE